MPETVVCIGTVVRKGSSVLLVRQSAGHPLAGQWTVPWGRLEAGESPVAAALRETREEAGIEATVEGVLGVQELPAPWVGWIALVYLCTHVEGDPSPRDREADAARFFSASELDALDEPLEPWSAWLVRRIFAGDFTVILTTGPANPFKSASAFL